MTRIFLAILISVAWSSAFIAQLALKTELEWYELLLAGVMIGLAGFVLVYLLAKVVLR